MRVNEATWKLVSEYGKARRLRRGSIFALEGDGIAAAFFLRAGAALIYRSTLDGIDIGLDYAVANEAFGIEDVFDGTCGASARATMDTELVVLSQPLCRQLQATEPMFSAFVLNYLVGRCVHIRRQNEWQIGSVQRRLSRLLEDLDERLSGEGERVVPFSQSDLASLVSASRQRVNPAIRQLAVEGVIEMKSGAIVCSHGTAPLTAQASEVLDMRPQCVAR